MQLVIHPVHLLLIKISQLLLRETEVELLLNCCFSTDTFSIYPIIFQVWIGIEEDKSNKHMETALLMIQKSHFYNGTTQFLPVTLIRSLGKVILAVQLHVCHIVLL